MAVISARTKKIINNLDKNQINPVPVLVDMVKSDRILSVPDPVINELTVPASVMKPVVQGPTRNEPVVPDPVLPRPVINETVVEDTVMDESVTPSPVAPEPTGSVIPGPVLPALIASELVEQPLITETVGPNSDVPNTVSDLDRIDLHNTLNTWDGNQLIFNVTDNEAIIENYLVSSEDGVLLKELNVTDVISDIQVCSGLSNENERCKKYADNTSLLSHSPQQSTQNNIQVMDIIENEIERCDVYEDVSEIEVTQEVEDPDYIPAEESTEDIIKLRNEEKVMKTEKKKNISVSQKRKLAQARRVRGKSYEGYKRSKEKVVTNTPRSNKELKPRCLHVTKEKLHINSFLCFNISDDERKEIFSKFWKLPSWGEKKIFVTSFVTTRAIRRRRKNILNTAKPKKPLGHDYFLSTSNGSRLKVCRTMFLNTLCLGEDTLKRWIKQETTVSGAGDSSDSDETQAHKTKRKKPQCERALRKEHLYQTVVEWLDLIPKVPSHYCRASTSREYVDNSFISKQNMYGIFVKWCMENNKKPTHLKEFKLILNEKKISIHKPRKDQCDTCVGFKLGTVSTDEYTSHRKKQEAGRAAKAKMKELAGEGTLVVTMDLQSVLTCPKLLASESYYKLKLQVHNFTIYALNNKKVTLYVWHEANGGVSSNEFTSCVIDYLSEELKNNFNYFILISDGCNYQNRNKTLASALNDFSIENNVTVQQLFLEKGHTMMEADSVHSTLEHYFYEPINSPTDYVARMRMARPSYPYNIKVLHFGFFKKFELPSNFSSIRPGKRVRDPVVVDIRQLKYSPNGEVLYNLDYTDNWQKLSYKREAQALSSYPILYKSQLPISDDKFKHLQELKGVIEVDHHPFYDNLPHQPKKKKLLTNKQN